MLSQLADGSAPVLERRGKAGQMISVGFPERTEAAEYYFTYINQIQGEDICRTLEVQSAEALALARRRGRVVAWPAAIRCRCGRSPTSSPATWRITPESCASDICEVERRSQRLVTGVASGLPFSTT
jgi:hypothetical protein